MSRLSGVPLLWPPVWDALWDKLLQPPRREPAEPEHVPTPEEAADPERRSRGEGGRP